MKRDIRICLLAIGETVASYNWKIHDKAIADLTQEEYLHSKGEYEATQYQRDRATLYAKLNQDELRFDDLENGTTTWQDSINAIKEQYPKPTNN